MPRTGVASVLLALAAWPVAAAAEAETGECSSLLQLRKSDADGEHEGLDTDGAALCAVNPQDDSELRSIMQRVRDGDWSQPLAESWASYQVDSLHRLRNSSAVTDRKLSVLLVMPLSPVMWETVTFNIAKLNKNRAGDDFKLALLHYKNEKGTLPTYPRGIEEVIRPHIAYEEGGPGCKVPLWRKVTPEIAAGFDYVWLLDGDMRLDYFDWDLYRHILLDKDPILSQPVELGWATGAFSTFHKVLRMRGPDAEGRLIDFWESGKIEQNVVLMSTKIWAAVHTRLLKCRGPSNWGIRRYYQKIADVAQHIGCSAMGSVVINVSPVRHANCRDMKGGRSWCVKQLFKQDCAPITRDEAELIARDLGPSCAAARNVSVWEGAVPQHCP